MAAGKLMQCVRAPFGALLLSWWPWLQKSIAGIDVTEDAVNLYYYLKAKSTV